MGDLSLGSKGRLVVNSIREFLDLPKRSEDLFEEEFYCESDLQRPSNSGIMGRVYKIISSEMFEWFKKQGMVKSEGDSTEMKFFFEDGSTTTLLFEGTEVSLFSTEKRLREHCHIYGVEINPSNNNIRSIEVNLAMLKKAFLNTREK